MFQSIPRLLSTLITAASFMALAPIGIAGTPFTLSSPDISHGKTLSANQVFNGFGCTGNNISPALSWEGAPEETKSFAITAYDPDAPTGSGWWHWVVFNIDDKVNHIVKNAGDPTAQLAPKHSVQGRTDFGTYGFGGACPPPGHGKHRYQFTLHALNIDALNLPADSSAALVGYMINQHRIAKTTIEAIYER